MSTTTVDPLSLLRQSTRQNTPVTFLNEAGERVTNISDAKRIQFSQDAVFPRNAPTAFKKTNATTEDETYSLDTLIFCLQNAQLDLSAYIKECRARGVEHVSVVDRRKIVDYLTGKVDHSPNVVFTQTLGKRALDGSIGTETVAKKTKLAPLQSDDTLQIVKGVMTRERQIATRTSILKSSKNFNFAITLTKQLMFGKDTATTNVGSKTGPSNNKLPPSTAAAAAAATKPITSAIHAKAAAAEKVKKLSSKDKIPIIIVPAAPTAKLNLYNIKQFLEDQKFVDSQKLRQEGLKKPERVIVERKKLNGQTVPYHVVDSVNDFKQNDWDRVSCVFVGGQLWQFKGWKWEKPIDLFSNVKGIYPKWNSDKVTGPAADWAVTELNIHLSKPHMNRATVTQFWDALDSYNATHKPYLNF
ncbi:RNA pol II accessory factor, Cdc73 family-domain-containing protein [Mycotypha africana]|uniref:RNA pol II accessory factor, Cdc73 family-domain-containing protein n=1 Tax=Mycotypha africana TaxID=64632 RepID=UPI002300CBB4|nr:RNA pol II accessory factor, Cdc73 family-domain-containing protein [Mycotypha africana]KAI8979200.1 RNA pol II accessory factor, Cdc73 family-domain-containing protein [Mycotypha africana]